MTETAAATPTTATPALSVDLPQAVADLVRERVAEGAFGSPGAYVLALIRDDLLRREEERIDALLLEGINSGPAEPMDWDELRAGLEEHIAKRQREKV